jgi:hypothetical protein
MAEIINILPLNPNNFEFQEYSSNDLNLIVSTEVETSFDPTTDYIEYYVYDLGGNIIVSNIFGFPGYKLIDNQVSIDPVADLAAYGYEQGSYNTLYNFLKRKLGSNPLSTYYIDEISSDRTEIRLNTTEIPNIDVVALTNDFINEIQTSPVGYVDFYLDFGDNQLIIANNILLDNTNVDDPTILIKLYEPLPEQFTLKTQCWVVQQIANSLAYNISITPTFSDIGDNIYINRPNFNLSVSDTINNSTDYTNYTNLTSTTSSYAQGTGSLQYQLNNLLAQKGLSINIDYSDYSNFIHFSSAQTRLENFYYKLQLLEQYTYSASFSDSSSSGSYYVSSSNIVWQAKIDEIITTFDPYEYYLYYTSASTAWPKTGNTPPYTNFSTTSTSGSQWFVSQSLVAEEYDLENNNALTLAIPSYILDNSDNYDFELFVEMIGQSFDSIFVYLQDVTNKYNADNRLNYGVSKDLVADILRDMGVKIYQNNFSSNDLYQALIGITPSGSLFNLPFTTTQFPVPTGSFLDYITTYVTSSSTSSLAPTDDINKERYKRIYHNLPLLLKKKGSVAGLRDLITTFGITDTILRINEFGGKDKDINSFDNWQNQFNYAFYTSGSSYISSSFVLNSVWGATSNNPQSVELRFKTDGLPQNTASVASQSLWETDQNISLILKYTGSGYISGSYSGSIIDPEYQYAKLDFTPDPTTPNNTASVYLPFYNEGWWSVLINKSGNNYILYAKNKNYDGEDGNVISFEASSSVTSSATSWNDSTQAYFGISSSLSGKIFTGSLQEIRYYTQPISEDNFDAYVMNPCSIESSEYLAFRAALGGELYTASISIHPKITGSWVTTSSFTSNSNFFTSSGGEYINNTEVFYFDQVPAGIQNAISQKIKQQNIVLPYSSSDSNIPDANVLSPFVSIQQFPSISSSYTRDIDYVEIGFSPQNEINEDINSQIGYFNLGEVIGDPRFQSSSLDTYPDLDAIRDSYFEKYVSNYQELDYIRLIEFFDNSLFKMLADFVPARTSLASGIIIKNTLLDRNRYRTPQVTTSASIAFIGSGSTNIPYVVEDQTITGSIAVGSIIGTNGGSLPNDYYLALNPSNYNIPFGNNITYQLSQSGIYNVIFNISSSGGSGATLKVYNSSTVPSSFSGRVSESVFTISSGNDLNTTVNFIADFSTQYVTIFNDNDTGSAQTSSISNIEIYHLPSYKTSTPSLSGSVIQILPNYYDFNGELNGSNLVVTDGDLTDYTIDINQVYTTGAFYANTPIPASQSMTFTNNVYDFNFDNVYYISFTAKRWGSNSGGSTLYLLNNGDLDPFGFTASAPFSIDIPGNNLGGNTGSVTVDKAEIRGIIPQTRFYMFTGGGSNGFSGSIEDFTVFESEISNPEFLVIENDAQVNRPSSKYMDVDFTTNAITAVNEQAILSGSATRATVPDSNYTTARIINPRYNGSRSTSAGFNLPATTGSTIGQIPNVEQLTSFFAYTPGGFGNTLATRSGSGNYVIGFLVDEIGTVYKPETSGSPYLPNFIDAFGADSSVVLSPTNNSRLTQPQFTVYKPAVLGETILYSDTGSLGTDHLVSGSYSSLTFNIVPGSYTQPYGFDALGSGPNPTAGTTITASFTSITDQASGFNNITDVYTVQNTSPVRAAFSASFDIENIGAINTNVTVRLLENNNVIAQKIQTALAPGVPITLEITSSVFLNSGSQYYTTVGTTAANITVDTNTWTIDPILNNVTVNKPYFTTGSTITSVLTSSAALGVLYGSYQQTPIPTGSGFNAPPVLSFQPYDEIRFEGNENLVSLVSSASFNQSTGLFHIFLVNPVDTTAIDVNYFAIRRWIPSINNLIINSPGTLIGPGLILPSHPSPLLQQNLSSIVENLINKGLISTT